MIIDELITDRTQADVDRLNSLQEKALADMTNAEKWEWLLGSTETLYCADGILSASDTDLECYNGIIKGAYNFKDLNRVGNAIAYVQSALHEYGYTIVTNPKTDFVMSDIPTLAQLNNILTDVETCRSKLALSSSVPTTPTSMVNLDYSKANNIEQILLSVYNALQKIIEGMIVYSDDLYCGEL